MQERGEEVSFELSSADATTAAPVIVYDLEGRVRAVGSKEKLVVTDVAFASAVAIVGDFYGGSGASLAAGERIIPIVSTTSIGTMYPSLNTPHYVKRGVTPQFKAAAAGQFTLAGKGFILKA